MYFLVVNVVGYGIAPLVIGAVSDHTSSLTNALLLLPACCIAAAAVLGLRASTFQRSMARSAA